MHVARDLSERDARAYRLADNRAGEESAWDFELLKLELKDLGKAAGELSGFDPEELEEYRGSAAIAETPAPIDQAAKLARKWGTGAGQAWQIGDHRLVCGDSTETADVGRLWRKGGAKLRMIWTDPPYGVDLAAKNRRVNEISPSRGRSESKIKGDDRPADKLVAAALALAAARARDGGQSLGQSPIAIHPHATSHDGAPLPMCCFGDIGDPSQASAMTITFDDLPSPSKRHRPQCIGWWQIQAFSVSGVVPERGRCVPDRPRPRSK